MRTSCSASSEEEKKNWMCRTTVREAILEYGDDLEIAATGAIAKKSTSGEVRVIFDGTNGVHINVQICVRDQITPPTAPDVPVCYSNTHARRARGIIVGCGGIIHWSHGILHVA